MKSRYLIGLIAAALLAVPGTVPASQPEVALSQPQGQVTAMALQDPYRQAAFSIELPRDFTMLAAAFPALPG